MIKESLDLMVNESIIEQSDRNELLEKLEQEESTQNFLKKLLELMGGDSSNKIELLSNMCKSVKMREKLVPHLHYWMIKMKIAEALGANMQNEEQLEAIEAEIMAHPTEIDTMLKQIWQVLDGSDLTQDNLEDVKESLKDQKILFDELKKFHEKQPVPPVPAQTELESEIKQCQAYLAQRKEDNLEIPTHLIDNIFREIQIQLGKQFIEDKKEPTELPLEYREYLEKIVIQNSRDKRIRDQMLQGKDLRRNMRILRQNLCGIDIHELSRMLKQGENIINDLGRKKGQKKIKVILFLGLSKAGKTTIITRLMGYEMKLTKIDDLYTIQPTGSVESEHSELIIGHRPISTTRYPRLYPIPNKFLSDDDGDDYITYAMDSAGFEDTAGSVVEIANRISTILALKAHVDKLQIAMVINEKSYGDTGEGVEKLAKVASSIVKNYKKSKCAITFVFNGFSPKFQETFYRQIQELQKRIKDQGTIQITENHTEFFKQLKKESKDQKRMLVVNPIEMDQKQFLRRVSGEKQSIEDSVISLIEDIGVKPKEDLKAYCERCKKQLRKCYENQDMKGCQYYLKMLKIISNPKFDSGADRQVVAIKNSMKGQLQKQINKFSVDIQQLQKTVIKEEQFRVQRLKELHKAYSKLEKSAQDFSELEQEDSEIRSHDEMKPVSQFVQKLEDARNDSLKSYDLKTDEWNSSHIPKLQELIDFTIQALEFYEEFAPSMEKNKLLEKMQKFLIQNEKKLKEQHQNMMSDNNIDNYFKISMGIRLLLKKQQTCPIGDQISEQYNQLKSSIKAIDFQARAPSKLCHFEENKNIQKISKLLNFAQNVSKYPKKMIESIAEDMKSTVQLIVVSIPKSIRDQFELKIQGQIGDGDNEFEEPENQNKQSANNIQQLIQNLKSLEALLKVPQIQTYHDGRLNGKFNRIEQYCQSRIKKFEQYIQSFNNNVDTVKKNIEMLVREFNQLQKMVKIKQKPELTQRFAELKEDFGASIVIFINSNDITQALTLNKEDTLRNYFTKYRKLKQFTSIYKIMGSKSELKNNIEGMLTKIELAISQPLKSLLNDIKNGKINLNKLEKEIQYIEIVRSEGFYAIGADKIKDILKIDTDIREQIHKRQILAPLMSLTNVIEQNKNLEQSNIDAIQKQLQTKDLTKCRKIYKSMIEIGENHKIKQEFFSNIEDNARTIDDILKEIKNQISEKLEGKLNSEIFHKLSFIANKLKTIFDTTSEPMFEEVYKVTREKIKELRQSGEERIKRLYDSNPRTQFDEENFIRIYAPIAEDETQNQINEKEKLEDYWKTYRKYTVQKLNEIRTLEIDEEEEDSGKKISDVLKILVKYYENVEAITKKLKNPERFKAISEIKNLKDLKREIVQSILKYCHSLKEILLYLKEEQIRKKLSPMRSLDKQIDILKEAGFIMEQLEDYKKQNGIKLLSEQFIKLKDQKKKTIQSFKAKNNTYKNNLDEKFPNFYNSCSDGDKKQIKTVIEADLSHKLNQIQENYQSDYQQYEKNIQQLEKIILFMPIQIKNDIQDRKIKILVDLQKQESLKFKEIENQQGCEMNLIIQEAKKASVSKNNKLIKYLVSQIQSKARKVAQIPRENIMKEIQQNIWQKADEIKSLPSEVKVQMARVQKKLIDKLKKNQQDQWKKFKKSYEEKASSDIDDSFSDISDRKKGSENQLTVLMNLYSTVSITLKEDRTLNHENKTQCELLQSQFSQEFQKYSQGAENILIKFKQIEENALAHQMNIEMVFSQIPLYDDDFKTITTCRHEVIKTEFSSKFIALRSKLSNIKKQLHNKIQIMIGSKFEFFNDEIKNNSDEQEEKRIQESENRMKILKLIQNSYNSYMKPQKEIILIQIEKQIKQATQKAEKQREKLITEFLSHPEKQVADPRIYFIGKVFEKISSKPRTFLTHCNQYTKRLYEEQKKSLQLKNQSVVEQRKKLQNQKQKQAKQYNGFQTKENDILQQKKKNINEHSKEAIKKVKEHYGQKLTNETDEEKKKKLKNQEQSRIKQEEVQKTKKQQKQLDTYKQKLSKYLEKQERQTKNVQEDVIQGLIELKRIGSLAGVAFDSKTFIDQHLKALSKKKAIFKQLYDNLKSSDSSMATLILEEHQEFGKLKGLSFSKDTNQTNNQNYILDQMLKNKTITSSQKGALSHLYKKFNEKQTQYHDSYIRLKNNQVVNELTISIISDGESFRKSLDDKKCIDPTKRVQLLAKIFALWSIIASQSDDAGDQDEERVIYYKVHAAQIICILVILNLDEDLDDEVVKVNRLAEVKTGEGKSIVLAALSIYFALFGYEVHCACYSQMLSNRDEKQFEDLFERCKIKDKIHYGIFEKIIKKVLNQKDDDGIKQESLESVVQQMITEDVPSGGVLGWFSKHFSFIKKFKSFFNDDKSERKNVKKVLIIDEIDVLFDKNFYGDTFNQAIQIRDPTIVALFEYIWKNKAIITVDLIKKQSEFENICKRFKPLKNILQNQIHGMICALNTYEDQDYVVSDKMIKYKVEDSLMDVSYGYNTVYAYLSEFEKGNISQRAYEQHLTIVLCVAQFSYACLPQYYGNVLGVTGTLTCMPDYIKEHLKSKYKITTKQMFPIPSVYGAKTQNRRIIDPQCIKSEQYFGELIKSIKQEFEKERPVLVFFRTKTDLYNFYSCPDFKNYQQYTACITEEHNPFERDQRLKNCSMKETITLLTSSFIRGTDFKLLNKKAIEVGGFHGIIAYLIEGTADYVQATGRVARQGKPGSFIQIFPIQDLELLQIDQNCPNPSKQIPIQRKKLAEKEKEACEDKLTQARKKHDETIKIFKDQKFDQEKLIKYVHSKNKFPEITNKKMRMILMVDATSSMTSLFARLKQFLPQIFDDVYETLAAKKVPGCLEMQVVLYRNYNSPINQLLQCSTFESQGENLKKFISASRVSGGWGNEAIQVGLQYVNSLKDIDQIILIGDIGGNTRQQVQAKRKYFPANEKERLEKGMVETYTGDQLKRLHQKKVSISGFYLRKDPEIKKYFQNLGQSQYIDIYRPEASQAMTQFIVKRVLGSIGGSKGDKLIEEYKQILVGKRRMVIG